MKQSISIIGAGFSGLMTAVHLLKQNPAIPLNIISPKENFACGVAYRAASKHHLLNVPAGRMSCFSQEPTHFVDWLAEREPFRHLEKNLLATIFVQRNLYGNYLQDVWQNTLQETNPKNLKIFYDEAIDIEELRNGEFQIYFKSGGGVASNFLILATGNEIPKNPAVLDENILKSNLYFQNPWATESIENVKNLHEILLIGNGLTMVDVVLGLEEQGFRGKIYSISPNGFQILPHRHNGIPYNGLVAELSVLPKPYKLYDLFVLFKKHIRFVRQFGISAEAVIDSVRLLSPSVWQSLSYEEKQRFLRHLRHLWGVARHRLPVYVYDAIQEKQRKGSLKIIKGKILSARLQNQQTEIIYWDKKEQKKHLIEADRIINCTGPNTDLRYSTNVVLKNLYAKKMIEADDLYLGIRTDTQGAIINQSKKYENFFTLGSTLKGLFWESTAVPELREQAEKLVSEILKRTSTSE